MITVETWQLFGGLLSILIALGGAAFALQRLGILRPKAAASPPPTPAGSDGPTARVVALETHCAVLDERTREYHVLPDLERRIAIIDERTRKHEQKLEGIGHLHARIDALSETSGRIEGELGQMNRQLSLVLSHLLGERAS